MGEVEYKNKKADEALIKNKLKNTRYKIEICKKISDTIKRKGLSKGERNFCYGKFGENHPTYGIKHSKKSIEIRSKKLSKRLLKTGGKKRS